MLFEFNSGTHPFTYINSTTPNQRIECRCITSWNSVFSPSTTFIPECWLRLSGDFNNFAITVDIDVSPSNSLMCFFPQWMISAGTLFATAKLINEGSSYPADLSDNQIYGGLQRITSNTLTFSASAAPAAMTVADSPSIYASARVVNTKWGAAYTLTLALGTGTITNPAVYLNFQSSGFIPDDSFCSDSAVFSYCRVYNTYQNIIVAQFITPSPTATLIFTKDLSTDLEFPKHKEPGANYNVLAWMRPSAGLGEYTHSGSLLRSSAMLETTTVPMYSQPDVFTSSSLQTWRSNVIISFQLSQHTIFGYYITGARIVITEDAGVLAGSLRGCTAIVTDMATPPYVLDCYIKSN